MPFEIIRNDITKMKVDALVNTANPKVTVGAGVDFAIHTKAGSKLLEARRKIGEMKVCQAEITPAFDLDAKYVIHVVGPIWKGGNYHEEEDLARCYANALKLAKKKKCESIAFPLISSGSYGFPQNKALHIAVRAIGDFLMEFEMQVYLVLFNNEAVGLSEQVFAKINSYIDEKYVQERIHQEYSGDLDGVCVCENARNVYDNPIHLEYLERLNRAKHQTDELFDVYPSYSASAPKAPAKPFVSKRKLEAIVNMLDESFSDSLLRLIDEKGKKDPEVYKKANIDRKLFSKIRKNPDYQPKKSTALALAIALELNLDETKDLLGKAGYTLTHSNKSDIIAEYFIENRNYDIFELNEVLFAFGLPVIGG